MGIQNNVCMILLFTPKMTQSSICLVPPYGKDAVETLQSVFDIKHLRKHAHFLNIQCEWCIFQKTVSTDKLESDRMPVPLGDFISEKVYDKKLLSEHRIHGTECLAFVDVTKGQEEKCGNSWTVSSPPTLCRHE